ncbi:CHAT domain-containing protein, partial [Candidatus Thiosymbion oneisti]|uniref:CHAT domain-containing protein n=1 Tax=Candidatus Thiosymbion oneisti TaxID=589554 RepID=UPI0013FD2760
MSATLLIQDDAYELFAGDTPIGTRRVLDAEASAWLMNLISRYGPLEARPDPAAAIRIGRDLYAWLDGDQHQLTRLLESASRPLLLSIHCPRREPSLAEWALLQAPWELVADERGHLAADALLQYSPQRRLGPLGEPPPPDQDQYRLGLAFMAAAPQDTSELAYEAEETAILDAVGDTNLDLLVDESGAAAALGRRLGALRQTGRLPVLHLSCHGDNNWRDRPDQDPRPVLLLEDDAGALLATDAAALLGTLRPAMPRLLFLSACRSAATAGHRPAPGAGLPPAPGSEKPDRDPAPKVAQAPVHSLTSALIQAGLPAVIGWDGTVADTAAIRFAATLYQRLAEREALALAVAEARRALLDADQEQIRSDWHLARLWLGSDADGAAPLVTGRRKRSLLPASHISKTFLGKEVPVASHEMFVGRRRELQHALRSLDAGRHAGLILTGMGRLGKSSLAARIANRRRDDYALAVLHGRFGPQALLDELEAALHSFPTARALLQDGQQKVRAAAQQGAEEALVALRNLLTDLLHGPCQQQDETGPALLLVLDDFEQLLEEAAGARPVAARYAGLVATILRAFEPTATDSRLLITSRFPFRLAVGGQDLAERLDRLELTSFGETAERKLVLRHQTMADGLDLPDLEEREKLLARARTAARGNPGLLDLLIARLLLNPAVPLAEAAAALGEMEAYLAGGGLPEAEQLRQLLENIAVQTLLGLAAKAGSATLLRAMTWFRLPVPPAVTAALAAESGGRIQDLSDLALLEPGADPVRPDLSGVRVSPLAAGRLAPLAAAEQGRFAAIAVGPLFRAWGGETGWRPALADLQLAELALAAEKPPIAAACGAGAVRALEADSYGKAARLGKDLIGLLEATAHPIPWRLYADAARVTSGAGDGKTADDLLERGIVALEAAEEATDLDALPLLDGYADRLYRRGQLDEALRIRTQEQLPVYERLGDVRSKAVTQGQIADILQARGQLDEALRIRTQEQLPVYERL